MGANTLKMVHLFYNWLLVICWCTSRGNADKFTIGYLTGSSRRPWDKEYSRPGLSISGAISLAIEDVTRLKILPDGYHLDFVVAETYGEETESILRTAQLWTQNVSVYIGPQETCVHEAKMAAAFHLPMISYFCTHDETSNKELFPTFARTRPPDTQISKSVASVLKQFSWHKVAFFYKSTDDSEYGKIAQTIMSTLTSENIEIKFKKTWKVTYHHGWEGWMTNPFEKMVDDTYQDIRIYVVLGPYHEHIGLLVAMEDRHLFDNGEYFVLGVDLDRYDPDNPSKYLRGLLNDNLDNKAVEAFENYLGVVSSPSGPDFDNFTQMVNDYLERPPFSFPNPLNFFGGVKRIRAEAAYLYDAVLLYAHALAEILLTGEDPYDGLAIMERIRGRTYMSAMGYVVYMDANGDTQGNYTLIGRQLYESSNPEHLDIGLYPVGIFHIPHNHSTIPELHLIAPIMWKAGRAPIDEPPCGFRGELCISNTEEIASGIAGGVVVILIIVLLVIYRNWRYEQELDSLLWKIDYKDIQIPDLPAVSSGQGKAPRSLHPLLRTSQVSLSSNPETDFRYSAIYGTIGVYKGRIYSIKTVNKKSIDMTRSMKKELKWMRDLRHENLNAFVGACVDPPNICIVTEYCTRGSLKDVLENDDVKLDNMFIASLVGDIVRAMIFIHDSPIKTHGNLKASNCLIDSRWVLKVADFGLHEFKSGAEMGGKEDDDYLHGLLYRAPELLRMSVPPLQGTQRGDIYSFGILLYAIHGRQGPYGFTPLSTREILKRVTDYVPPGPPFRPPLEALESCMDCVCIVMVECWKEQPDERPDFKTIRSKLRPMRKGLKPNIFDNMNYLLEKYTNNLEALVDERTEQLLEEKKKTEALLYEMLPRYVADQLKRGNKVEAESYESVTIYFSDIVGFTEMSAQSSPLEVVDFLNDLYTCFDSIIGNYDVYKVETIGDAYMVVSGLPLPNGDLHAGHIASMALDLLRAVTRFKIRHRPHQTLMLRIGIHSGPVCAGVVGLKMPRYCLFGDTVNTSSRMESTGLPLKIHCSLACKQLLDRLGGYILEERGAISVKGKGDMVTYWLVGEAESRRMQHSRLKSSMRNANRWKQEQNDLASSLDSPKKLRFAATDSVNKGQPSIDESALGTKRNSCPNLKVGGLLQPNSLNHSIERKVKSFYRHQPQRLSSTSSLVEALIFNPLKTPNGRTMTSPIKSIGETPKIELSPPEETGFHDCWPLLDTKYVSESDRETTV